MDFGEYVREAKVFFKKIDNQFRTVAMVNSNFVKNDDAGFFLKAFLDIINMFRQIINFILSPVITLSHYMFGGGLVQAKVNINVHLNSPFMSTPYYGQSRDFVIPPCNIPNCKKCAKDRECKAKSEPKVFYPVV